MSKILFQRIVSLHAAASELAETIRLERLVDTGQVESRSLAARGAYRAVERRLLTLSRFFSLGRGEVSDESQGALPGLWEYGKYYPAPETSLGPGELDDIVAGVSRLFEAQNSLFEIGFARGYQSGQAVPASIGRSVMHNLERGIELLRAVLSTAQAHLPETPEDDSAWVTAATLWHDRFTTIKEVTDFRKGHTEMFRTTQALQVADSRGEMGNTLGGIRQGEV